MAEIHLMLSGFNFLETVGDRRARLRAILQVAAAHRTTPLRLLQEMNDYEVHVLRLTSNPDQYRKMAIAAFDQYDEKDLLRVTTKMAKAVQAFCVDHQDRLPDDITLELPVPNLNQYAQVRALVLAEIEIYIETIWPGHGHNWSMLSTPINA